MLKRNLSFAFFTSFAWLIGVSVFLPSLLPQLELDRFFLVIGLLATIPSAHFISRVVSAAEHSVYAKILAACLAGFLLAGARSSLEFVGSRRINSFGFASPLLGDFTEALKEHSGDGRILFSGFVLHDLEGGHIAPLTQLTNKPMVASSHIHNKWQREDIMPSWALQAGDEGIDKFLDLYNVSAVVAHENSWKNYFQNRPEFSLTWSGKRFVIFNRNREQASYFLEGKGKIIKQSSSGLQLRMDSTSAVIKFKFVPGLKSSNCKLKPKLVAPSMVFTEIANCDEEQLSAEGNRIKISSKSILERIVSN